MASVTLGKVLIGAGGWAYFRVPGTPALEAYSKAFNFVEVNSTFYSYPRPALVASWRRRVPRDFEFAVRCHKDLTHKNRLKPVESSYRILKRMIDVCRTLRSDILHLQTPPSFTLGRTEARNLNELVMSPDLNDTRIALETRGGVSESFLRTMKEHNIIHCVDVSREESRIQSDVLYSRLFGKGEGNVYQFDDGELKEISRRADSPKFERSILAFHGVRMYGDAARLKVYREKGQMPLVTGVVGKASLRKVLEEDGKFPVSKSELIKTQGWKLVDVTKEFRVRVEEFLQKLPDERFTDIDQVIRMIDL